VENQRLDLGLVSSIQAESFGEPGHRTFRLFVETPDGQVSLWLEKEQVVMLGSAVAELLERVPANRGEDPESDALKSFQGELEARVGSLSIGYDASLGGFTLEAADLSSAFDLSNISSIGCLATRAQFSDMRDQIEGIVAAGRPRCPLCSTPLSGGPHFCPESNGHAQLSVAE
jgi:uncharacterized repeat protein (TIGR03847 family)